MDQAQYNEKLLLRCKRYYGKRLGFFDVEPEGAVEHSSGQQVEGQVDEDDSDAGDAVEVVEEDSDVGE